MTPEASRSPGAVGGATRHHFTVDVEEFFHSTLLADRIPTSAWDDFPRRAPLITAWLLEEMEQNGAKGTFFVLGWLAEREPDLVRRIAAAGHEVAAHSWWHRRVGELSPEEFRLDVRRTRSVLEDLVGKPVVGFRAPSFSIVPGLEWAFDVLLEEGYTYDSSLFPIRVHPGYGYPEAERDPYVIRRPGGALKEFPLLTWSAAGRRLPAAGGAYLRFFPAKLAASALAQAEGRGAPGTLYLHPWDLDPDVPRVALPRLLALRLHGGAARARSRVRSLLGRFSFTSIAHGPVDVGLERSR